MGRHSRRPLLRLRWSSACLTAYTPRATRQAMTAVISASTMRSRNLARSSSSDHRTRARTRNGRTTWTLIWAGTGLPRRAWARRGLGCPDSVRAYIKIDVGADRVKKRRKALASPPSLSPCLAAVTALQAKTQTYLPLQCTRAGHGPSSAHRQVVALLTWTVRSSIADPNLSSLSCASVLLTRPSATQRGKHRARTLNSR